MIGAVLCSNSRPALAQVSIPSFTLTALGRSTQPLLASEAAYHVVEAERRHALSVSVMTKYPIDSIQREVAKTGQMWLAHLGSDIQGMQQDPWIELMGAAGDTGRAKKVLEERVRNGLLSLADRAMAYRSAVMAFANQAYPERLADAEAYLTRLDALGDSAAFWRYQARRALMHVYFSLGRSADVRRLGGSLFDLVPRLPYNERTVIFAGGGGITEYDEYVAALTGEPGAAPQIAKLNAMLEAATKAPATWIALDPAFGFMEYNYRDKLTRTLTANALLGTVAHPLVAHVWLNRTTRDSVLAVNDGKIHVIELANTSCAACMEALQMIQRLQKQHPSLETVFLTYTYGYWGNRLVSADEEVPHIIEFLNTRAKITMPAGIWKSRIITNEDDGRSIQSRGPNWDHYPTGKMSVWVVDGRGIIRRFFEGLDRKGEDELARTVAFLARESAADTHPSTMPPVTQQ